MNESDTFLGVGIGNMIDLIYEENYDIGSVYFLNNRAGFESPLINNESRKTWIKTYKKIDGHIQFVSERDDIIKIYSIIRYNR